MGLLPEIATRDAYRALHRRCDVWRPAIDVIAQRHGIAGSLTRPADGSNIVVMGSRSVIKLFCPLWAAEATIEACGLEHCAGRLPVQTPTLEARGELEGWPYLVVSRLPGRELGPVWATMDRRAQLQRISEAAELSAALHALPVPTMVPLPDATRPLTRSVAELADKHRNDGCDAEQVGEIVAALRTARPQATRWELASLLHGDIHPEHLLVAEDGRLCGLFDFADAMVGPPEYDLAATVCLMAAHVEGGAASFYRAYGIEADDAFRSRIAVALLAQRYCALPWAMAEFPESVRPRSVAELLACCG